MIHDVPSFATWLLQTFATGPNNENLAGDIAERYAAGRSRFWYWRQVLAAIFVSLFREVRSNGLMAIRALVVGWGLFFLTFPPQKWIMRLPWPAVRFLYVRGWIIPACIFIAYSCIFACAMGWIIGRLNRPYQAQAVLLFTASWFVLLTMSYPVFLAKSLYGTARFPFWNFYFLGVGVAGNMLAMFCALVGGVLSGRGPRIRRIH
jgi:hypothetical protein